MKNELSRKEIYKGKGKGKMKVSKESKSNNEANSSQTRAKFDLREMIIEENCKIMENIEEVLCQ